jgi:hypothetical protein
MPDIKYRLFVLYSHNRPHETSTIIVLFSNIIRIAVYLCSGHGISILISMMSTGDRIWNVSPLRGRSEEGPDDSALDLLDVAIPSWAEILDRNLLSRYLHGIERGRSAAIYRFLAWSIFLSSAVSAVGRLVR